MFDGQRTYVPDCVNDPDKYRAGVAYVGFAGMKVGVNSGGVRHAVQNRFAHDFIGKYFLGGKIPWFNRLPDEKGGEFYFDFGMGSSTLW